MENVKNTITDTNKETARIIKLTRKQEDGIKIAKHRYSNNESYTCIAGYA